MRRQREWEQREEKDSTKHWHPPALSWRRQGGERSVQGPGEPAAAFISSDIDFHSHSHYLPPAAGPHPESGVGMARPLTRVTVPYAKPVAKYKACTVI